MVNVLSDEETEALLQQHLFGHLGCNDGFNTYIFPVNYLYDGKYIICQSLQGSKTEVMRQNKRVCFLVDEVADFNNWKSVMVLGEYQELYDKRERDAAIKLFNKHMLSVKITNDADHSQGYKPIIYRIAIDEKTGRYENG